MSQIHLIIVRGAAASVKSLHYRQARKSILALARQPASGDEVTAQWILVDLERRVVMNAQHACALPRMPRVLGTQWCVQNLW